MLALNPGNDPGLLAADTPYLDRDVQVHKSHWDGDGFRILVEITPRRDQPREFTPRGTDVVVAAEPTCG
jgi:hypothetical protein